MVEIKFVPSGISSDFISTDFDFDTLSVSSSEVIFSGVSNLSLVISSNTWEVSFSSAETSSPSSNNNAMAVFTETFSVPSGIKILPIIPSSTASNSIVALSVSISAIISPLWTLSPSLTIHLASVPSSIVGDNAGIRILIVIISLLKPKCLYKVRLYQVQGLLLQNLQIPEQFF